VQAENRCLHAKNQALSQQLQRKDAYIRGLQEGLRNAKRIGNRGGKE